VSTNVIYKIRNLLNGKFYVGSAQDTRTRFRQHRRLLRKGAHHCKHLQNAWNKYGEELFKFEVVEHVGSVEGLEAAEDVWLMQHVGQPHCYNSGRSAKAPWRGCAPEDHPNFGKNLTDEQKQNLRDAAKHQWKTSDPRTGRKHSEQTKAKIKAAVAVAYSEGRGGAYLRPSEETRKKMSEAQKGNQYAKGHIRTEEHRRKLSEANKGNQHWKGKNHSEEAKAKMGQAVKMIDPDGNETIYPRTTAIKEKFGIFLPTIQRSVRSGKALSRGPYKGWRFEYI
jgi:group I intron endonuclease